jgi:hypothetical protein
MRRKGRNTARRKKKRKGFGEHFSITGTVTETGSFFVLLH